MNTKSTLPVAVVIPNFNGEKYIENCLDSLKNQTFKDFDIVVVDDGSSDSSLSLLRARQDITLIENPENVGFAESVNRGICHARSPYVLLLNNDVTCAPDFVGALYAAITDDSRCFAVSSRMVRYYERDKMDDAGDNYNLFGWAWKRGDGRPVEAYGHSQKVFSACAGAAIYRRAVFETIGLFDAAHFAYLEDIDVSWRARIYGYHNRYCPEAVCYHIGSATTADGQKYSPFKVRLSARNNLYIIYKNMPLLQWLCNIGFLAVGFLIKGLHFSRKGYGRDYRAGLKEGFTTCRKLRKVPFRLRHLWYYIKIEGMLIGNLFGYVFEKLRG